MNRLLTKTSLHRFKRIIVLCWTIAVCSCQIQGAENPKEKLFRIHQYYGGIGRVVMSANSENFFFTAGYDTKFTILQFDTQKSSFHPVLSGAPNIYDFAYLPEKDQLAVCLGDFGRLTTSQILIQIASDMREVSITHPEGQCFTPSLSPVENAVVYSCDERNVLDGANLFLTRYSLEDSEQQELIRLTSGETFDAFPMFMPDGKHIVFFRATRFYRSSPIASEQWHCWKPYMLDIATLQTKVIYDEPVYNLRYPKLSSNGLWLAYGETAHGFVVINLDRELCHRKHAFIAPENSIFLSKEHKYNARSPIFSADARRLVYFIQREDALRNSSVRPHICILDLETQNVRISEMLPFHVMNLIMSNKGECVYIFASDPQTPHNTLDKIVQMSLQDGSLLYLYGKGSVDSLEIEEGHRLGAMERSEIEPIT